MSNFQKITSYLKYLLNAQTKYYIHSPFVYELSEMVLYDKRNFYAFDEIAAIKAELQQNHRSIEVTDFGAGSSIMKGNKRKISDIARYAGANSSKGKLYFKLINYFEAKKVLELGTSLGIGTLYLAKADQQCQVTTIEACPNTLKIARQVFEAAGMNNIHTIAGTFEEKLPSTLEEMGAVDIVLFDGNHQKAATLQYFETCLPYIHDRTVFVFDDIHWSSDMTDAWKKIKAHPKVSVSIDLYQCGLVFFHPEQRKEQFILQYFQR